MKLAKGFFFTFIGILLFILFASGSIYLISYSDLLDYAVRTLGREDLRPVLENRFFTFNKFLWLKSYAIIFSIILFGLLVVCFIYKRRIISFIEAQLCIIRDVLTKSWSAITSLSIYGKLGLVLVLLLLSIRSIYYATYFLAQYDECWNYNYFLSNSFFTSIVAYNNYPLHNLISYVFIHILPDNIFIQRLPSMIFGLFSSLVLFLLVLKKWQSEKLACFSALLFACLPMTVFYFLFARGVTLSLFFALILLYFVVWDKLKTKKIFISSLFACLGTYSMLSFPIFVFAICIPKLFYSKQPFKKNVSDLLVFGIIYFILCLIVFSPMLLGTGISLATESDYIPQVVSMSQVVAAELLNARVIIGFRYASFIAIALNILFYVLLKRYRPIVLANFCIILICFFLPYLSHTILPARALSFEVISYLFTLLLCSILIKDWLDTKIQWMFLLCCIVTFSYVTHHHIYLRWSSVLDRQALDIATIFKQHKVQHYYNTASSFSYFVPAISYYFKKDHLEINYKTLDKGSTRYEATISPEIEALVLLKADSNRKDFPELIYQNEEFKIVHR